jgi:lambda family phage tail tape measure protein
MSDRELSIRLAADASELKRAQAEGAAGFGALVASSEKAAVALAKVTSASDNLLSSMRAELAALAAVTAAKEAQRTATTANTTSTLQDTAAKKAAADVLRIQQLAMRDQRVEANLLKQANRQLAMQMTDVVTSVASGMPVWMVAIQQGGQIKDAYGGIVPAGRAVMGMLTPMTLLLGGTAAAMAVVAVAYNQGAGEAQAYGRALALTNNISGTTIGQLNAMARAMSTVGSAQNKNAEVLALAAGSGAVAAQNLQLVAKAAIDMERVGGAAAATTVAQFAELGRAPVAASEKLNAQVHYLTASLYDQIRALERQGKLSEAGVLAQKAYADAVSTQNKDLELQLGGVERAWRAAGDAAKFAWSAFLGIGRQRTPEEELELLQKSLAAPSRNGGNALEATKRREATQARVAELQQQIYMNGEMAAAQQAAAESADEHIRQAAQRDAEAKARAAAGVLAVKDALQARADAYANAEKMLDVSRGAGLLSEEAYYAAKRALITLNSQAQVNALAEESAVLAKQTLYGAEAIARDAQVAHNKREMARIKAKAAGDAAVATDQERFALEALSRAQVEYGWALERTNAERTRANSRDLAGRRQGDDARGVTGREAAIADQFNNQRDQLESDRFNNRITQKQYTERLAMLRQYYNQALEQEQDYQDARRRVEADASVGFERALANYAESSRNVAQQTERMWSNAFNGMEDAIVRFAITGKASFSDLANSIIADLIRIYLRKQLTGMFGSLGFDMQWSVGASGTGAADANTMAGLWHGGGVLGTDQPARRQAMPASTWANAPRLHTGRMNSDEYAAILQRGESVLTPGQMRQLAPAGSGGGTQVMLDLKVINQSGTPVQASARRDGNSIEVLLTAVKDAVADDIGSGQGNVSQALQGRYGLRPVTG